MQLSDNDLRQIEEAYLERLGQDSLRSLSGRLLLDLKEARERLKQNSRNSSLPPSWEAPWGKPPARDIAAPEGAEPQDEEKMFPQASDTAFSPDYGATNNQNRWLLALSQRLTEKIAPQWLLYGEDRQPAQLGLNVTALVGDSTVLVTECSGGQSRSQLSQAGVSAEAPGFHNRVATGATYTASNKLSCTLEYAYNDAAPNADQWNALQRGAPVAYGVYRLWAQAAQELPTRDTLGLYVNWPDALVQHLDLSAMVRANLADNSRTNWLEARYHWSHTDLALQLQVNSGGPSSDFGAAPQQRIWQVSLRQYY